MLKLLEFGISLDWAIYLLGIYPKEITGDVCIDVCATVLITALWTRTKTEQQATVWVRDCCFPVYSSPGIRILICICICGPWLKSVTHPRPLFLLCYAQYKCMWFLRNLLKEDCFAWTVGLFPYWIVEVMVGYGSYIFVTWGNNRRMVGCGFWHCGNHCMSFENYYAWTDTNFNPC